MTNTPAATCPPMARADAADTRRFRYRDDSVRTSAGHGHLWRLTDGTGAHARPGELTVDDVTGRLCCHLCGRWYVSLGSHVRVHGHTAATYRAAVGLCLREPLTTKALSASIADRQARAYQRSEQVRDWLAEGRAMRGRTSNSTPNINTVRPPQEPAQRVTRRRAALQAGRQTIAARREADRADRLARLGYATLDDYLRAAYTAGASLDTLAAATGLGRARLRAELDRSGVTVRPTGINTPAGRRSRAVAAEQAAARRLGTDDLHGWLRERHAAGWPLTRLAAAVGHSTHWVRWRLDPADDGTRRDSTR